MIKQITNLNKLRSQDFYWSQFYYTVETSYLEFSREIFQSSFKSLENIFLVGVINLHNYYRQKSQQTSSSESCSPRSLITLLSSREEINLDIVDIDCEAHPQCCFNAHVFFYQVCIANILYNTSTKEVIEK